MYLNMYNPVFRYFIQRKQISFGKIYPKLFAYTKVNFTSPGVVTVEYISPISPNLFIHLKFKQKLKINDT